MLSSVLPFLATGADESATEVDARNAVRPTSYFQKKFNDENEKDIVSKICLAYNVKQNTKDSFHTNYLPIAGAKAETVLLARAMAAKAPMMEEKRNMLRFFYINAMMKILLLAS